jgi:hypothetical protein
VREVQRYLPDPEAAAARPPGAVAVVVIGSWTSSFGRVTFCANGTFTVRLGDGSEHCGSWSADADGVVHAEVIGTALKSERRDLW